MSDKRSSAAQEYRRWYRLKAWKALRRDRLAKQPLCERCLSKGNVTAATVVNHRTPHRGNWARFFDANNLESVCKPHHDGEIQSEERRGYSVEIGADGFPVDPRHPFNAGTTYARHGWSIPQGVARSAIPVHLVAGPPGSGKTTYVRERASDRDLILDLDDMVEQQGGERYSDQWWAIRRALEQRDRVLRSLATELPGRDCWLIVTAPTRDEREAWCNALGCTDVRVLATPAEECLRRLRADPARAAALARQADAVAKWWGEYRP